MIKYIFALFVLVTMVFANVQEDNLRTDLEAQIYKEFGYELTVWNAAFNKKNLRFEFRNPKILFTKQKDELEDTYKLVFEDFYPRFIHILLMYKRHIKVIAIDGDKNSVDKVSKYILNIVNDEIFANEKWLDKHIIPLKQTKHKKRKLSFLIILDEDSFNIKDVEEEDARELAAQEKQITDLIPKLYVDKNFVKESYDRKIDKDDLRDNTLRDYVIKMLVENPTINEQFEYLKSLQMDVESAKAAFKPVVTLNYMYTEYQKDTFIKDNMRSKDITLNYNLFNGFKDKHTLDTKVGFYKVTKAKSKQITSDTLYKFTEAYVTLVKVLYLYDLSRKNYMDYIDFADKAKIRFQNGLISLANYSKIQARTITRYVNFEEDTKRYADAVSTLKRYIDFDDEDIERLKIPNPQSKYFENLPLALEEAVQKSPYVEEAEENIKLYKDKMKQVAVNFYPNINLTAKSSKTNTGYTDNSSDASEETSVMINMSINLYNGDKDYYAYKKALYEYRQKLHKRDSVIMDVKYNVNMAFDKYVLLEAKKSFLAETLDKREQQFIASNYDYKFTKIDANGLLDALDALYNAKRQYAENEFELITTKYKLVKEIGALKDTILYGE